MQQQHRTSVRLETDKSEYILPESVTVTVFMSANQQPTANEQVKIFIFEPNGKRLFRTLVITDRYGIATAVFRLQKKHAVGSYSVEVQTSDNTMSLTSFLAF